MVKPRGDAGLYPRRQRPNGSKQYAGRSLSSCNVGAFTLSTYPSMRGDHRQRDSPDAAIESWPNLALLDICSGRFSLELRMIAAAMGFRPQVCEIQR